MGLWLVRALVESLSLMHAGDFQCRLLLFFYSNNIHAPGVVGEYTLYTLPRGLAYVSFFLGMKPSVVQYLGLCYLVPVFCTSVL